MSPMKRLLLLFVVVLAATTIPAAASAAVPCRNKIYNDWYHDGRIASTYPISCYRDALKNVHGDARVYSSLTDDIRSAMQAAIARTHGKRVPAQVGKGPGSSATNVLVDSQGKTVTTGKSGKGPLETNASGPVADSGGGGGIPLPLLVLGGLALLLAAAGAIGLIVRRGRGGDAAA